MKRCRGFLFFAAIGLAFAVASSTLAQSAMPSAEAATSGAPLNRCIDAKVQPGWIFEGACATIAMQSGGTVAALLPHAGFALKIAFPENDAAPGATIVLADATKTGIRPSNGKAFPLDYTSYLYVKLVNKGAPIHFTGKKPIVMTVIGSAFQPPCSAAYFTEKDGAWPAYPDGTIAGNKVTINVPSALFGTIATGVRYMSFECKSP